MGADEDRDLLDAFGFAILLALGAAVAVCAAVGAVVLVMGVPS